MSPSRFRPAAVVRWFTAAAAEPRFERQPALERARFMDRSIATGRVHGDRAVILADRAAAGPPER
jgi:hypothetical protein